MGKISFLAGVGVGYVLGAAAGRQRFEQIKSAATKTWNNPKVQQGADAVQDQAVKGAKAAASSSPQASKLVDKATSKVEEKTGKDVSAGTSSSSHKSSDDKGSGQKSADQRTSTQTSAGPLGGAPTTGSQAPGPVTARSENTDREATGTGVASDDSGFTDSKATPGVVPVPNKGTSKP